MCAAEPGADAARVQAVAARVVDSGRAWVSTVLLRGSVPAIRACITNHRTTEEHVDALVGELEQARH